MTGKGRRVAQKLVTRLTDDLDGKEATETVEFGLDGVTYLIDLSERNAARLRKALEPFVAAGRRQPRNAGARKRVAAARETGVDPAAVRAWAASHKIKVSPRGRISGQVIAQFRAAGN
jgi:hypothetical protein